MKTEKKQEIKNLRLCASARDLLRNELKEEKITMEMNKEEIKMKKERVVRKNRLITSLMDCKYRWLLFFSFLFTLFICTTCTFEPDIATMRAIAHNHIWGEWAVTTPPTFTKYGEETRTCTLCNREELHSIDPNPVTKTDTGLVMSYLIFTVTPP